MVYNFGSEVVSVTGPDNIELGASELEINYS